MYFKLSQRKDSLKRFLSKVIGLIVTYLNFLLVVTFLIPWIYGKIAINDLSEVITIIEVFVLGSATLSLVTFTYISAMTNLHEKVKNSMILAGESFFMATIQFIVGLGLFLVINLIFSKFIGPSDIILIFSWEGIISIFLLFVQLLGIFEVASALSNFLKAIFEVYRQFRIKKS